ncbi:MAG TPA: FlgD immunoglobulin-like domain containing protein, partial [Candidatus Dormibacteraeota bacterium]|nr:FlgD immunoglobulin-like domain containing protein [Candidatus Dormibacteraeota bacterium]
SVTPNPLNPRGVLRFSMSVPGEISARLFDVSGRLVRTIAAPERLESGDHQLTIDGRDDRGTPLATGVYFYRLETEDGMSQGRVVIAK